MFKFKPTQKFRVIINGVSVFTTARTIRMGIGDLYASNAAAQKALVCFEATRDGKGAAEQACSGLAGRWEDMSVQIDLTVY